MKISLIKFLCFVFVTLMLEHTESFPTKTIGRTVNKSKAVGFLPCKSIETKLKVVPETLSFLTTLSNSDIASAFNIATFLPQPLWGILIFLPTWKGTKKIMGNPYPIIFFCLVHLFIVVVSTIQPDGTAPISEFSGVFDPQGNPQQAMIGMMRYPNFVSEEWSHVLTWDLLIGQLIWMDGLRRGIFTSHSVLLTNLIGPPGLLLHFLTCIVSGKGLPPFPENNNSSVD